MESNSLGQATPDRRPPTKVENQRFVYLAAIFTAIGGLLFGYDTGVISSALIFMERSLGLSTFEEPI